MKVCGPACGELQILDEDPAGNVPKERAGRDDSENRVLLGEMRQQHALMTAELLKHFFEFREEVRGHNSRFLQELRLEHQRPSSVVYTSEAHTPASPLHQLDGHELGKAEEGLTERPVDVDGLDNVEPLSPSGTEVHEAVEIKLPDDDLFGFGAGDIDEPQYNVENYYKTEGWEQALARSPRFQNLTCFVVVLNAIYMGVDTDRNTADNLYKASWFFLISSFIFVIFFTFELGVRLIAFKFKRDSLRDGWFKFDLFLVITMLLDQLCIEVFMYTQDGKGVQIPVQPLRLLRLLKLSRMARLMRAFPELVTMVRGMVRSLRAISSSAILVGLMTYTCAVFLHMLLKDEDALNKHIRTKVLWWGVDFSTVPNCMWVLFMHGTLILDSAAPLMTVLIYSPDPQVVIAGLVFVSFLFLTALLILQMLIGVLCDVVSQVGQERRDSRAVGVVRQELLGTLKELGDGEGNISQAELLQVMSHAKCTAVLEHLNINRAFLLQMQNLMFPTPQAKVSIKAILELMIMCRGEETATVQTLAGGLCFVEQQLSSVMAKIISLDEARDPLSRSPPKTLARTMTSLLNKQGLGRAKTSEAV